MGTSTEVDAWFAARDHPLTDAMQLARRLILEADPRVTESIKWKTPTFSFQGNIVSFNPAKKLVSLLFHRGAEIPGQFPRLEGDGRLARVMRFADVDEVEQGRTSSRPSSAPGWRRTVDAHQEPPRQLSSPIATGRSGSADHCDQEPGHRAASMPAAARAATSWAAVTPDPQ